MADVQLKAKVSTSTQHARPSSRGPPSRPASPSKPRVTAHPSSVTSPPIRAKAKVSSSAQVGSKKAAQGVSSLRSAALSSIGGGAASFRPHSPIKQLETRTGRASPTPHLSLNRARTNSKLNLVVSVPPSPRIAHAQLSLRTPPSETSSEILPGRPRHASISSVSHVSSSSSLNNARGGTLLPPASPAAPLSSDAVTASLRITSKLTGVARRKPYNGSSPLHPASPTVPSPPVSSPKPPSPLSARVGSNLPSLADPPFYPITTASPVANAYRFETLSARHPSSTLAHSALPSTTVPADTVVEGVDPASVPLPPLSPSSTLSFSSRSSFSHSSYSTAAAAASLNGSAPRFTVSVNGNHTRSPSHDAISIGYREAGLDRRRSSSVIFRDFSTREVGSSSLASSSTDTDEERKVRAEAKSNRKIADLEITNKSLLTINASLEDAKHRQAKEIRELRRKLRETRLVLPPLAYRQLKKVDSFSDEDEEDEEDEDEELQVDPLRRKKEQAVDETFERIRTTLEHLLDSGRKALATTSEDFASVRGGTKVLHEAEARTWREGQQDVRTSGVLPNVFDESFTSVDSTDDELENSSILLTVPNGANDSLQSEEEVEIMMSEQTVSTFSPSPP